MHASSAPAPGACRIASLALALSLACLFPLAGPALAAPTLGFVEHWSGTTLHNWGGGPSNSNPGSGGVLGAGDGFLRFSTPHPTSGQRRLGVRTFGTDYAGNWTAAGITQVHLWLNDVEADDPLEMHFSIGIEQANFWQYDVAFLPPHGQWAEFVVDLSSPTNWTQTIGPGTFAAALQGVTAAHVRHDHAPFIQEPDFIDGEAGLDRVLLTNGVVGVAPGSPIVPRAIQLAAPTPNPSRGAVSFALEVYDDGPVTMDVVDAAGRLVRRAELAAAGPGPRIWVWDGRDAHGRSAPAGYYRVRAMGRSGGVSRGLVRVP